VCLRFCSTRLRTGLIGRQDMSDECIKGYNPVASESVLGAMETELRLYRLHLDIMGRASSGPARVPPDQNLPQLHSGR
jgi:hypothetical protein